MRIDRGALEFFESLPDDILIKLALYDWEALERLCVALTLDMQVLEEGFEKKLERDLDA